MTTAAGLGYARVAAMQEALGAAGTDLLVLAPTDNLRYALGGFSPPGATVSAPCWSPRPAQGMVIPSLNLQQARENMHGIPFFHMPTRMGRPPR